ncbi:PhzF family phenazine biosynthesis protein [Carnimonas bestiolae]|uniref:PhzF family phenazine biosynthesis protein n=1 Tax=Carnimonas bestiolae TaxID=3402172 RepID=UPI003EDC4EF9
MSSITRDTGLSNASLQHLAAFSVADKGGNPAGVVLCDALPEPSEMQAVAKQLGYSETVFACQQDSRQWRVRYFAPEIEVPFCGHATIALGAALAKTFAEGEHELLLNIGNISVKGKQAGARWEAELRSPPTRSSAPSRQLLTEALKLFGWLREELDERLAPALAEGGACHLVLPLANRSLLAAARYNFSAGRRLMEAHGLTTIALIYAESSQLFHARNMFAAGGVYEDPATGAAAAALAGYLRDAGWPHHGTIDILQGYDMGIPCRLMVRMSPDKGSGVWVSGSVRELSPEGVEER